jgi:hypothetical protein
VTKPLDQPAHAPNALPPLGGQGNPRLCACSTRNHPDVPWTTFRKNYEFTYCDGGECRVGVLPFLYEISTILTEKRDLRETLSTLLNLMEQRMKVVRGMVALCDRKSGEIFIHQSFGLT